MNYQKAVILATTLMQKHLDSTWTLKWGVAKRTFGSCYYPHAGKAGYIRLSKPLAEANDEAHLRDTILHEIAHALAGYDAGHGYTWKVQAARLGARTTACKSGLVADPKYVVYCTVTKTITQKYYRKPGAARYANLHRMQVRGKPETLGKLVIITFQEYKALVAESWV